MSAEALPAAPEARASHTPPVPAPPTRPRPATGPPLADGFLTPLEAALMAEIRDNGAGVVAALGELKAEIRAVRVSPPFRWVPWVMLLLWLLNMFVIGILALERGVDLMRAAEVVKVRAPSGPVVTPTSPRAP